MIRGGQVLVGQYQVVPRVMGRPWQGATLQNLLTTHRAGENNFAKGQSCINVNKMSQDPTTLLGLALFWVWVNRVQIIQKSRFWELLPPSSCCLLQIRGWELSVSSAKSFQPNFPEPLTHKLSARQTKDPQNPQHGLLPHLNKKEMISFWFSIYYTILNTSLSSRFTPIKFT